ncbi:MAG: protein adenylyltransferase SelO [Granulosicoccaceae bacterium]
MLKLNHELARELSIDADALQSEQGAAVLCGAVAPAGAQPLAMVYAGHQFGGYSPQLGDGRALLLGEILDKNGQRRDLHLKGSGRTPFSRNGDGKAALGPVLREYLIGEAMYAQGIPTTRALAATLTGERVMREGHPQGAVLARVASSHLRVGTFQYVAASGDQDKLKQLADYAIARHYPELQGSEDRYLGLLRSVGQAQAALVSQWVSVGFVHGVMNTDNVTISGETIDYGPCAFIDQYDPKAVFSSIDSQGRYAYGNQPNIAQWNLTRFAETLLRLIEPEDPESAVPAATEVINDFAEVYRQHWLTAMRAKLGLMKELPEDLDLCNGLMAAMEGQKVDYSQLFRSLSEVVRGEDSAAKRAFVDATEFQQWLQLYQGRGEQEDVDSTARAASMDRVNPLYIPRNHRVEEALQAAETGDMQPFELLLDVLAKPFERHTQHEHFVGPAPDSFGPYTTYCGT